MSRLVDPPEAYCSECGDEVSPGVLADWWAGSPGPLLCGRCTQLEFGGAT